MVDHDTLECSACGTWCPRCAGPDVTHSNCDPAAADADRNDYSKDAID